MEGTAAFAPLSEAELQERMALEEIDGPVGSKRDDTLAGFLIHAAQVGPVKDPQFHGIVWDAEEAERQHQERLRMKMQARKTG